MVLRSRLVTSKTEWPPAHNRDRSRSARDAFRPSANYQLGPFGSCQSVHLGGWWTDNSFFGMTGRSRPGAANIRRLSVTDWHLKHTRRSITPVAVMPAARSNNACCASGYSAWPHTPRFCTAALSLAVSYRCMSTTDRDPTPNPERDRSGLEIYLLSIRGTGRNLLQALQQPDLHPTSTVSRPPLVSHWPVIVLLRRDDAKLLRPRPRRLIF